RVELNFHPDRKTASGQNVAEGLLSDGVYRSQFQTGISNGSVSSHPGGFRYQWEHGMFGGAYDDAPGLERPKYGALNLMNWSDGSAPRFGSCYFGLLPSVSQRTTFSYGDSASEPTEFGTTKTFDSIWAAMLRDVTSNIEVLGLADTSLQRLARKFQSAFAGPDTERFQQLPGRVLDDYIEAQVHGEIRLERDVEFLAIDPSFAKSSVGDTLASMAKTYGFPIYHHRGFRVDPHRVPDEFRGPDVPRLAKHLWQSSAFSARDIGEAASSFHANPEAWTTWGTKEETLQLIKQLWHCLVQFGVPYDQSPFGSDANG
ncbi:MAG: DUF3626 domain-containing protein, partial [Planctomycetota bacterium]